MLPDSKFDSDFGSLRGRGEVEENEKREKNQLLLPGLEETTLTWRVSKMRRGQLRSFVAQALEVRTWSATQSEPRVCPVLLIWARTLAIPAPHIALFTRMPLF